MRKPYGTVHRLTTQTGSRVTIHNDVDEYGRGHSHVVTGVDTRGHSAYFARNVGAKEVGRVVRAAEAAGWTRVVAGLEAF